MLDDTPTDSDGAGETTACYYVAVFAGMCTLPLPQFGSANAIIFAMGYHLTPQNYLLQRRALLNTERRELHE